MTLGSTILKIVQVTKPNLDIADYFFKQSALTSLEYLTNHPFTSVSEPNSSKSSFEEVKEEVTRTLAWFDKNKKGKRAEWVALGFAEAGYQVFPASDVTKLKALAEALQDQREFIRYNAWMELRKRTGMGFDQSHARDSIASYLKYFQFIARQSYQWVKKNEKSLVWSEEKSRFLPVP